ncbi:Glutaredoxin [Hondaea fermentalgiana]|uniref:Glutaredoxin n=1 Tax=Hondaea fermentalgiana TaxID=2315210 RepID=A0A2R5GG10_9STRA|nr:Glutaredoxin [Hondaea fermentalgiana]|eukprot:GBG28698.1 Glutaredoxin [Hondaea fermentalgiana]
MGDELDKALEEHTVVVVSKTWCGFCSRVKSVLGGYPINDMVVLECDSKPGIQSRATELTGQRTVPNVFIAGKSYGGCDKVVALHNSGQLQTILSEAGALE